MYLLLDGMWEPGMRVSLLWPWAGSAFPPLDDVGMAGLWAHLLRDLADPVNLAGEPGACWYWGPCGAGVAWRMLHDGRAGGRPASSCL